MRVSIVLPSMALLALIAGCCIPLPFDDADEGVNEATVTATPTSAAPAAPAAPSVPQVSEVELQGRKVSEYSTACINIFSERAFSARARYVRWADVETGPTGRERGIGGINSLRGDVGGCRSAVTRAASMPPAMPNAERAANDYATALETLVPLLTRANRYYERESYRDDDMAQGRQMHAPLMSAFTAFASADRELRSHVVAVQDRARQERLTRLANEPSRRGEYLVERTMAQAVAVVRIADDLEIEDNRYVSESPQELITLVQTLQAGVDELIAHRSGEGNPRGFRDFRREAEQVLESALGLMRRVRDETPFTHGELALMRTRSGAWMNDGTFEELLRCHNQMIDRYNRMRLG